MKSDSKMRGTPGLHALVDLDDTLYEERSYFLSGIRAVAQFAASTLATDVEKLRSTFTELLAEPEGRTQLFDRFLRRLDLWSPELVATFVYVYRTHLPSLSAYPDVLPALRALKQAGCLIGLVSDGPATVQRAKLSALGLGSWCDAVVLTDDLPTGCRKPSPVPFLVAARLLDVPPSSLTYIADDPSKDFIAPRGLGMRTICVDRGLVHPLRPDVSFTAAQVADVTVPDFGAAVDVLLSGAAELGQRSSRG